MAQPRKCTTEFVQNDKARLATFKRRSHCLLKKASELSTLCDVDVAVLIYADHLRDRPLVYPPDSGESLRIVKKLKENPRCVPASKSKPDKFLNQANHRNGPNDKFCDDITSLNVDELNSLLRVLDAKEAEVIKKIEAIEQRKNAAGVEEEYDPESDPNRFLFNGNDHHSMLFHHQSYGYQGPVSFSVLGNEDSGKQLIENNYGFMNQISGMQLIENNYDFLNQISGHENNYYNDGITSFNVGEGAVDQISEPDCLIFIGDDGQSELLDNQFDGFQRLISVSVMGEDNTSESKSEHSIDQNSSLWNPISGHSNILHYDEPMSLDISESDLAQIMDDLYEDEIETFGEKSNHMLNCWNYPDQFLDPNRFILNGDGWPNPRVDEIVASSSYSSGEMSIHCPYFYKVGEDTPKPNQLTEINSWLLDDVVELEEAKDESNTIDEKTIETTDCKSFSENGDGESLAAMFYDEVPDTNCLSFDSMYDGYESLDYQSFSF